MMRFSAIVIILTIAIGEYFHTANGQRYSDQRSWDDRYSNRQFSDPYFYKHLSGYFPGQQKNNTLVWCTTSKAEQDKCNVFKNAVDKEKEYFGRFYVSLTCLLEFNKEACMTQLDNQEADLTTLDPGEVFTAGRYHSLLPIMQEIHRTPGNVTKDGWPKYQYSVAVIKKGSLPNVSNLHHLRGTRACFAGVGTLAGWVVPMKTLMDHGGLKVMDCNNHVKSAIEYFGPSCAVNSLLDRYNPLGDNRDQLCELCIGEVPGKRCTSADPYADYEGAFRCLVEAGEIAFLVHSTVFEMTSTTFDLNSVKKEQFELLCTDGSRASVDDYERCNWGRVPSRAIVTSSATDLNTRTIYSRFLEAAVRKFSKNVEGTNETDPYGNQAGIENRPTFEDRNFNGAFANRYGNRYDNAFDSWNNGNFDNRYDDNRDPETTREPGYNANGYDVADRKVHEDGTPYVQPIEMFDIFESAPRYGLQHNLLFSDTTVRFLPIRDDDQSYVKYLGPSLNSIMDVRRCPVNTVTLCVTSIAELKKCIKMKDAMNAQLLKPQLACHRVYHHLECMQDINTGRADIAVFDASDVYTAGLRFNQVPFMAEVYNLNEPAYYVVAVAKESDPTTELTYLKNKYTCHTGINTAAGWVYPMAYLLSNTWIRGYGCDSIRAAAEYFTKSCIPGALSSQYNTGVPYDNMCDLCHGESSHYCSRDASEPFYGHTGAFRCLVEGGGDVAFVKHTTVYENTNGKRKEYWARNTFSKEFELLCTNGTRNPSTDYEHCNLGKVKANAMVMRGGGYYGLNETEMKAYVNLFLYAQQFYGKKDEDEFSFNMFSSASPYTDLIFQDATQKLVVLPPEQREFSAYLGPDFMRARRVVDCQAGASAMRYSIIVIVTAVALTFNLVP